MLALVRRVKFFISALYIVELYLHLLALTDTIQRTKDKLIQMMVR